MRSVNGQIQYAVLGSHQLYFGLAHSKKYDNYNSPLTTGQTQEWKMAAQESVTLLVAEHTQLTKVFVMKEIEQV